MLASLAAFSLPILALAAPAPAPAPSPFSGTHFAASGLSSPNVEALSSFGNADASKWSAGATIAYQAHGSCNASQKAWIGEGLDEALMLAGHARAHLRRYGNDTIFQDWFGNETNSNLLLGLYDRLVDGDKAGLSFRCDDPDNECDGKYGVIAGYFRADDHDETVMCPTYWLEKPRIEDMCAEGWNLAENGSELTQGAFFMHRLLHTPTATGGGMSDVVDTAEEALELAKGVNHTQAAYSIHTIQYYALDVYATDILVPGVGCRGNVTA
ncbi:hypothetical protein JCM10207_003564 [Rhodosporidiobolus poonsookiae]